MDFQVISDGMYFSCPLLARNFVAVSFYQFHALAAGMNLEAFSWRGFQVLLAGMD